MHRLESDANARLSRYTRPLSRMFEETRDMRRAHERAVPILQELAADKSFLSTLFEAHLHREGALNTRHYPSLGIEIAQTPKFNLVANCFLPRAAWGERITANSIHHHGSLYLTTVTAHGPGYEHWRFSRPELIDPDRSLFRVKLLDRQMHVRQHVSFVDSHMPHAVMFPDSLTVTFALWSSNRAAPWRDQLRKLPFFQARKAFFLRAAKRLRLARFFGINVVEYFDYFPVEDGLEGMRERIQFQRGPNEDYLYTLFHVIQATDNAGLGDVVRERLTRDPKVEQPALIQKLLDDLRADRSIPFRFSAGVHDPLKHMNFAAADIERCLARLGSPIQTKLIPTNSARA
jgi:hypothetical protein